jgi:hypothetical protein
VNFAYFLLAKQKKVSALSGAYPDMQRNQHQTPRQRIENPGGVVMDAQ